MFDSLHALILDTRINSMKTTIVLYLSKLIKNCKSFSIVVWLTKNYILRNINLNIKMKLVIGFFIEKNYLITYQGDRGNGWIPIFLRLKNGAGISTLCCVLSFIQQPYLRDFTFLVSAFECIYFHYRLPGRHRAFSLGLSG